MLRPRWQKVWRDLFLNRIRFFLVVASITLGVTSLAVTLGAKTAVQEALVADFAAANASSATLYTSPFDYTVLASAADVAGVMEVQGRQHIITRFRVKNGPWINIEIYGLDDFATQRINKAVLPQVQGAKLGQIMLESSALKMLAVNVGESIDVQTPSGQSVALEVVGFVRAPDLYPANFTGRAAGYVTLETASLLTGHTHYNELTFVASEDGTNGREIGLLAQGVKATLEGAGTLIYRTKIPLNPGAPPLGALSDSLLLVLSIVAIMCLCLSGFLIANTLNALMGQHIKQIGVMKALGATTKKIWGLYSTFVLLHSIAAITLSLPLAFLGTKLLSNLLLSIVDVPSSTIPVPFYPLLISGVAGLLIPFLTAQVPIWQGIKLSIREALVSYGITTNSATVGQFYQTTLPRPILYAWRNSFRRKGRLVLTLLALALAGTMFITIISLRQSLTATLEQVAGYWQYDIEVNFTTGLSDSEAGRVIASRVEGTDFLENWRVIDAFLKRPDGSENENIFIIAAPIQSAFISPKLIEGRWLQQGDQNAIVVNADYIADEPYLKVGGSMMLTIDGKPGTWTIVGICSGQLIGPVAYVSIDEAQLGPPSYNRLALRTIGQSAVDRERIAANLEGAFTAAGIPPAAIDTYDAMKDKTQSLFNILTSALLALSLILALVGSLSLTGTISLNILERSKEIGILRAIGATDRILRQIILYEGLGVGLLSAVLAAIISMPASYLVAGVIGQIFLKSPLNYRFSYSGVLLWLLIALLGAAIGSLIPARRAQRLSVRDALAAE